MKKLFVSLFLGLFVVGCAKTERVVVQGKDGVDGKDGVSCVASDEIVDGKKIGARVTCGNTFALILNGTDGVDGKDAISISGSVATTSECATGGYVLTVGTNKYTVCNGLVGATGPQGSKGDTGATGPKGDKGEAGAGVTPILLCNKEYGLKVGNQVYAVFHQEMCATGPCGANPDAKYSNTYLALLAPRSYVTTDGTNCSFTVNNDGTVNKIIWKSF